MRRNNIFSYVYSDDELTKLLMSVVFPFVGNEKIMLNVKNKDLFTYLSRLSLNAILLS